MRSRFIQRDQLIFLIMVLLFLVLLGRAFYVQILQADFLQSEGNKRQIRVMELAAPRGDILDRHQRLLALSTPVNDVWVDPKVLGHYLDPARYQPALVSQSQQPKKHQRQLERIRAYQSAYEQMLDWLQVSKASFTPKLLAASGRRFMYLKRHVLPKVGEKIRALDVPGVYVDPAYKRYYPAGEVASHWVGFNDIDDRGIAGIEKIYNDWLQGVSGKKQVVKDRTGRVIHFVRDLQPAKTGQDLVLSMDQDLQFFLYQALKRLQQAHQARSAMSVIVDARSGEILAMVSVPGFNANDRNQLQGPALRNRVVTDRLEPGSTVKPFVVAKAMDLGLVTPETVIETGRGRFQVQGEAVTDTHAHGDLTVTQVLQRSSNVGVAKIALKMSAKQQWQMYHSLGFGQDTGLFLPGETLGYLKPAREWQPLDQTSTAFGYGFNINLLQLAQGYLALSHQGERLPLSVIKGQAKAQASGQQVIAPETANQVLAMLETVVGPGGTAPQARIEGYRVAGKTGTVHLAKAGGYEPNRYTSLFAGLVPVSDPKFVMVTAVTDPSRGVYYGGQLIGPVFAEVMQEALRLYQVPPDAHTRAQPQPDAPADAPVEELAVPPGMSLNEFEE